MKILIVADVYPPTVGGLSTAAYNLAHTLLKRGHEVVVLATSSGLRRQKRKEKGILVHRFPSAPFPFYREARLALPLVSTPQVVQTIRTEHPDVVHLQSFGSIGIPALIACKTLGIPTVSTDHMLPGNMSGWFPYGKRIVKVMEKNVWGYLNFFLSRVDLVSVPSKFGLKALKENTKIKEAGVISNGIKIPQRTLTRQAAKEKLGLKGKRIILDVGRVAADKNFELLIEAFPRIQSEVKEAYLVFVGMGPLLKKYRAKKLPGVKFTGYVSPRDLEIYYQAADVFCMPSLVELQGLSPLEAASFGVPLVLANSAALPELIENNGYTFEAKKREDLAEKIVKILKNSKLQKEFSENSLKLSQKHSLEEVVKKYEELYAKAAALPRKKTAVTNLTKKIREKIKEKLYL